MTGTQKITTFVSVHPWYRDHRFDGRAVLPAVEAMALLAGIARSRFPNLSVQNIEHAEFTKFLELPPHTTAIEAIVELTPASNNRVAARLSTRKRFKTMSRLISHCYLTLGGPETQAPLIPGLKSAQPFTVNADRIYQELVPFGPTYRTLQDLVLLTEDTAHAKVKCPGLHRIPSALGSPFCLDGAMHAACVHGQQLVDFIPFPVSFASRTITLPTQSGEKYQVDVHLCSATGEELVYDLQLRDQAGVVREMVTGLRMRDVSSGCMRPPQWIRSGDAAVCLH